MTEKPALASDMVREFVGSSHGDIDAVRELLKLERQLVNAAWDWGGGDWETGLGAAAHMGRRDIALVLLEGGARMDIFAAAMLGETEIVRAMVTAFPELREATGPHGIPLLEHARAGGDDARDVLEFLQAGSVVSSIT
jgi:hypothetical protein